MGPNGPPNANATAKFAPEIAILGILALLGHFGDFWQNKQFWSFWPATSELERTSSKKIMWGVAQINQTELCAGLAGFTSTGSQTQFSTGGAFLGGHFPPNEPFWSFWPAISEPGQVSRKKYHFRFCLNQRDRARPKFSHTKLSKTPGFQIPVPGV